MNAAEKRAKIVAFGREFIPLFAEELDGLKGLDLAHLRAWADALPEDVIHDAVMGVTPLPVYVPRTRTAAEAKAAIASIVAGLERDAIPVDEGADS